MAAYGIESKRKREWKYAWITGRGEEAEAPRECAAMAKKRRPKSPFFILTLVQNYLAAEAATAFLAALWCFLATCFLAGAEASAA